jgi:hypothetical protein
MKSGFRLLAVVGVLSVASSAFAFDPSGNWGIEGRSDALLTVSQNGPSALRCQLKSNYSTHEALAYFRDGKFAGVYSGSHGMGFMVYEPQGENRMVKKALSLEGKNEGGDNWVRIK